VSGLRKRGIGFRSLHEAIDTTTTPGGRLVFHVFAALAEFIRELLPDQSMACLQRDERGRAAPLGASARNTSTVARHSVDNSPYK